MGVGGRRGELIEEVRSWMGLGRWGWWGGGVDGWEDADPGSWHVPIIRSGLVKEFSAQRTKRS